MKPITRYMRNKYGKRMEAIFVYRKSRNMGIDDKCWGVFRDLGHYGYIKNGIGEGIHLKYEIN